MKSERSHLLPGKTNWALMQLKPQQLMLLIGNKAGSCYFG